MNDDPTPPAAQTATIVGIRVTTYDEDFLEVESYAEVTVNEEE